jgi:hypothetical protein
MSLAAQGYIITAIGGDPTNGLLLVGTRVKGDTMPRPTDYVDYQGLQGSLPQISSPFHAIYLGAVLTPKSG